MIRIIITILIKALFMPKLNYGQKNETHNKINGAFDYGKKANEYAVTSLNYIKICFQQSTLYSGPN
jgi:hypothetical protein